MRAISTILSCLALPSRHAGPASRNISTRHAAGVKGRLYNVAGSRAMWCVWMRPPANESGCTAKMKPRRPECTAPIFRAMGVPIGPMAREERIIYRDAGYRMIALDARTGIPVSSLRHQRRG